MKKILICLNFEKIFFSVSHFFCTFVAMKRKIQCRLLMTISICLFICCSQDSSWMRSQLVELEEANRSDSVMYNDSLAEVLVNYFNKYGSDNERMRAYYILGRTYFDLGELPRALETYQALGMMWNGWNQI